MSERLPGIDWGEMYANLRRTGAPYQITFGNVTLLSNSRAALEAGESARKQGGYDRFHEAVFRAYFTDTRDIGRREILLDLSREAGLDATRVQQALDDGRYFHRLQEVTREARHSGIGSAPTFIINGSHAVVGAQPIESFRELLQKINRGEV